VKRAIQILLVDDHQVVRDGLQRMLEQEEDLQIVGQGSNAEETLNRIDELSPDVVLMDIKMPGMDGIELTRQVKKRHPTCNIIMLTLYDQYLPQAIDAGAKGYLLKDIKRRELAQAIRNVQSGQVVTSESIKARVTITYEDKPERTRADGYRVSVENAGVSPPNVQQQPRLPESVNLQSQGFSQAVKQVREQVVTSEVIKSTTQTQVAYDSFRQQSAHNPVMPVEEIQVVLPPPVEASQLMKLADRIEEVFHSRVMQMVGSWQEGTIMTVVLPQAVPIADIVATFKKMPEVGEAGEQPPTQAVGPALLGKAEAIPRINNRNRKPVFISFEKGVQGSR